MNSWLKNSVNINRITLSFSDKRENEFRAYYFRNSINTTRFSIVLVMVLYLLFSFLDNLVAKESFLLFVRVRFFVIAPVLIITFILSFHNKFILFWQELLFVIYLISASGIIFMMVTIPEEPLYSSGLMLIFLAGSVLIKLRFFISSLAGWLSILIFNFIALVIYGLDLNYVITNDFFFMAALIIGMFAAYNAEIYDRQNFELISQIAQKSDEIKVNNENLEQTVELRTKLLNIKNQELEDEISRRIIIEGELVKAKERAEQSDRLKSAFLANMSHEIRTQMNAIIGFSNLLTEVEDKEELNKFIDIIVKNGDHLLVLINDIIDLSRIEAGILDVHMQDFNINSLLSEIYDMFIIDNNVVSKKLKLIVNKGRDDENAFINTDYTRLKQIIINLVNNASKYTEEGSIEIGYSLGNNTLYFYVKDTGVGISEKQQAFIFDRFMQITLNNTPGSEGNGLGLAITQTYLKMMGGSINLRSKLGVGSEFSFKLPVEVLKNNK
jgi:signal transduction histidine kinase